MSDAAATSEPEIHSYPARLDIDYPEAGLGRASTIFRVIFVIPIAVVLGLLTVSFVGDWQTGEMDWESGVAVSLFVPTVLMILFRQKYPRWWFDWNLELTRFAARVYAYLALMRDEYPSTDEPQAVPIWSWTIPTRPGT